MNVTNTTLQQFLTCDSVLSQKTLATHKLEQNLLLGSSRSLPLSLLCPNQLRILWRHLRALTKQLSWLIEWWRSVFLVTSQLQMAELCITCQFTNRPQWGLTFEKRWWINGWNLLFLALLNSRTPSNYPLSFLVLNPLQPLVPTYFQSRQCQARFKKHPSSIM